MSNLHFPAPQFGLRAAAALVSCATSIALVGGQLWLAAMVAGHAERSVATAVPARTASAVPAAAAMDEASNARATPPCAHSCSRDDPGAPPASPRSPAHSL
jgi:hypothetical protein